MPEGQLRLDQVLGCLIKQCPKAVPQDMGVYVVGDVKAVTSDLQGQLMHAICDLVGDDEFQRFVADDIVTDFEEE